MPGCQKSAHCFSILRLELMELDKVIDQLKPKRSQDDMDPAAISGAVKIFLAKMDEVRDFYCM